MRHFGDIMDSASSWLDCPKPYSDDMDWRLLQEPPNYTFEGGEYTPIWPCTEWRFKWWNHKIAQWTDAYGSKHIFSGDRYRHTKTGEIIWTVHFPVGADPYRFARECRDAGLILHPDYAQYWEEDVIVTNPVIDDEEPEPLGPGGIPPTPAFCEDNGGVYSTIETPSGQMGICTNPETGQWCGAWAFLRGECDPFAPIPEPGVVSKASVPTIVGIVLGIGAFVTMLLVTRGND